MTRRIRYRDALAEALAEEMRRDETIVLLGEDIGVYGGVFKVTAGFLDEFGPDRVLDTPISENGLVGAAVGAAMTGLRPVVEIMYCDFLTLATDSLVNSAALFPFTYGGQVEVPLVVRTQGGAGASAGPQHSKSLEAWAAHIPGLNVVLPATPSDAKGLLKTAIRSDRPTLFCEHKLLYNSKGEVPDREYLTPIGSADVKRTGGDVTITAVSRMVVEALAAAEALETDGIDAEVVDVRSLRPLDIATVAASVEKTGRAVIVSEAWRSGGPGAEIAASLYEQAWSLLQAPIVRLGAVDLPIPYSPALEPLTLPSAETIARAVRELVEVAQPA